MRGEDVDRRLAIVTCHHCGAIFDLTKRRAVVTPESESKAATGSQRPERAPAALPERFTVVDEPRQLEISWRWFRPMAFFLLFFAIVWNGFLVFWYGTAIGLSGDQPGGASLFMFLFPLAHVAVGLGLAWFVAGLFLNRTIVTVDSLQLQVRHKPLPWWPAPTIPVDDLEQLFVKQRINHGKNGTSVSFELRAVTRSDKSKAILKGLTEVEQALWLEQAIEKRLGIRDRAVAGEMLDGAQQF